MQVDSRRLPVYRHERCCDSCFYMGKAGDYELYFCPRTGTLDVRWRDYSHREFTPVGFPLFRIPDNQMNEISNYNFRNMLCVVMEHMRQNPHLYLPDGDAHVGDALERINVG